MRETVQIRPHKPHWTDRLLDRAAPYLVLVTMFLAADDVAGHLGPRFAPLAYVAFVLFYAALGRYLENYKRDETNEAFDAGMKAARVLAKED